MGVETNAKIGYAPALRGLLEMDSKDINDLFRPIFDDSLRI
jgi:hypothetical protein